MINNWTSNEQNTFAIDDLAYIMALEFVIEISLFGDGHVKISKSYECHSSTIRTWEKLKPMTVILIFQSFWSNSWIPMFVRSIFPSVLPTYIIRNSHEVLFVIIHLIYSYEWVNVKWGLKHDKSPIPWQHSMG